MSVHPGFKVAIVKASSYDPAAIELSISQVLSHLGGLERFVRPGMSVLLKPNLLSAKAPERGITTHPEFVAAVGRIAARLGARVRIGDSPAGAEKGIDRLWNNCGLTAIAARDGFELVNFESSGSRPVEISGSTYHIAKPVLEADLVISLPKLKTHVLTLMTGGIKNTFGSIPGFRKGLYHKEAPNPRHFSRIVVDIFAAVRPGLTIMDAVLAMEGDGPSSGTPRPVDLVLASENGVAIDVAACAVIGLPSRKVHTIRYASEMGLGPAEISSVEILGERIEAVRPADFKLTSNLTMELLPKFVFDSVSTFIWERPKIEESACTRCGSCVDACPVDALVAGDKGEVPVFRSELCINCWCCHEICPSKAVVIDKSWLARKLLR